MVNVGGGWRERQVKLASLPMMLGRLSQLKTMARITNLVKALLLEKAMGNHSRKGLYISRTHPYYNHEKCNRKENPNSIRWPLCSVPVDAHSVAR